MRRGAGPRLLGLGQQEGHAPWPGYCARGPRRQPPARACPLVRGRSRCACSDSVAAVAVAEAGLGLPVGGPLCLFSLLLCYRLRGPWELITPLPGAAGWTAAGRAMGTSPRLPSPRPVAPPALGWAAGSGAERSGVSIPTAFAGPSSRLCFPHGPRPTPGMVRKGGCG